MKIIRYSSKPIHCDIMKKLFDKIEPRLDNFNILTCLHIALMGTNLQICHQKLIEKIITRMNAEISTVRLKELDRMSLVISLFDFESPSGIEVEFMRNVLDQLKIRVEEIVKHPRCFTSTIHYLSTKGFYDLELIEAALKQNFIHFAYGENFYEFTGCLGSRGLLHVQISKGFLTEIFKFSKKYVKNFNFS